MFGLLGLFLCFYFTVKIIPDTKGKWFFTAAVLTACLFSVIFTTHLRELRYYNFVLLINAALVAIYTKDKFTNEKPGRLYYILVPVLLLLQLLNFLPGFFAFGFAVFLFEAITIGNAWRKGGKSAAFKASVLDSIRFMIPILISFLYLIPYNIYFQAFHINSEMNAYNLGVGFQTGYLDNLKRVLNYYQDFEWVFAFILFKVMVIALRGKIVKAIPGLEKMLSYSDFLFIFWAVFLLMVSNAPNFVFVRYHFGVIPFLWITLFLDLGVLLRFAYASGENQKAIFVTGIFIVLASNMTYVWVGQEKYFSGKMNEIKYQYKGPLDFVIPWIVKNIPDYQSRNVATNYEEACLMYYLDCKVSFGFLGSQFVPANIERADVIFFRNFWIRTEEQVDLLKALVSKDAYETISFKGKDVPFNRLPEPYSGKNKLEKISASKTLLATHPEDETRIFVRKKLVEDKKSLKPNPE